VLRIGIINLIVAIRENWIMFFIAVILSIAGSE